MSAGSWLKTQMKQKSRTIFKGPVVFYPLLFAAFPILFLYVYNISETSVSQIWLPLVTSVAATLVLWVVLSLILRSLSKAGFATAIFLVFFVSYGRLYEGLGYLGVFVPKHAYLLPAMLLVFGYCVYFIGRAKRDFRITTRLLNITAVALIAINLFNIGAYQVKLARLSDVAPVDSTEEAAASPAELSTLPDIYLIIPDEYAHPDTMKEWYDYDNSQFIESLEDKGFFIAYESRTRVIGTGWSVASTLNMEYVGLDTPPEVAGKMIFDSKVVRFLKSNGYKYVHIESMTVRPDAADLYYNFYLSPEDSTLTTEFLRILLNTTMLRPFYNILAGSQYESLHRTAVMATLEKLKEMPDVQGPKFVYAHVNCPHDPYVFGPTGEPIPSPNYFNWEDREFYLGQYVFISKAMEEVVEVLLENSSNPPIVIIQSDHGPKFLDKDAGEKILNAYYLPGDGIEKLYPSISPVNSFRLIFNHYFGASYEFLED